MGKDEMGVYSGLKERLEEKLADAPDLHPYGDLLRLLELSADVAAAETHDAREEAVEELRSFLV